MMMKSLFRERACFKSRHAISFSSVSVLSLSITIVFNNDTAMLQMSCYQLLEEFRLNNT